MDATANPRLAIDTIFIVRTRLAFGPSKSIMGASAAGGCSGTSALADNQRRGEAIAADRFGVVKNRRTLGRIRAVRRDKSASMLLPRAGFGTKSQNLRKMATVITVHVNGALDADAHAAAVTRCPYINISATLDRMITLGGDI